MRNKSILNSRFQFGFLMIASLAVAVGVVLFANTAGAQSTNWFINFDVPGAATANGWTNYYGPGAYTNSVSYVVVTNTDGSFTTNVVNNGYYWNAIADNTSNSSSLMVLGDGTTASSSIVFSNMDISGAPGYSPIGAGQGANYPNYGDFWALFLPYQHDGGNTTGPLQQETNILYNVPPGTYNLYVYGMNASPAIATDYADSQCDRGTTFKIWSDLTPNRILSDVNATNSGFFARGVNYVRANNIVTSNGVIFVSYAANTTVYAKYNGSTTLVQNHEGDFDGLQLVFVSTNTTPIPSPVTLTNVYPNGNFQFQSSPTLSFNALSTNGIDTNQISISLSATILGGHGLQDVGQVITTNLTFATGGITISGDLVDFTNILISTPLVTNALYSATITVVDLGGNSQTLAYTFDTIDYTHDYVFEAADYNYATSVSSGGHYFDNPQTNAYASKVALTGIDFNNPSYGPALYRGANTANPPAAQYGLATELCGDIPTPQYYETVYSNYDVPSADTVPGNWGNYTRTFPAGAYNGPYVVYMRAASVQGQTNAASLSVMSGTATSSSQSPTLLGNFSPLATGGQQTYEWVPLLNTNGTPAVFIGGGVETVRITSVSDSVDGADAGYSANCYLFIPINTNSITLTNIYPDGTEQFQATNAFTVTIKSSDLVSPTNIFVSMIGTNLLGQTFATNLTGSALTIGGSANNQVLTVPVISNAIYDISIQASDASGITVSTNLQFDTVAPAFIFEAEDYDYYAAGLGDGNPYGFEPFTDSVGYGEFSLELATLNVDYYDLLNAEGTNELSILYRGDGTADEPLNPADDGRGTLDIEACSDLPHTNIYPNIYIGDDYDLGNATIGNWANYTRVEPAGTYNVYMRAASAGGSTDSATLSLVTSGQGTSNQVTTTVGTFSVPDTGGYQTYSWVPLEDAAGNAVRVSFDGTTANTLRVTDNSTGFNVNYYMLIPADTALPTIYNVYPNGAYQFQNTNSLSFNVESSAGINNATLSVELAATNLLGTGSVANLTAGSGLSVSGAATNISVSVPLQSNTVYQVVISATSQNGETTIVTNAFDTVEPAYLFAAADFNFNGGQFVTGAGVDAYSNLDAVAGIDTYDTNFNTTQVSYRTNGLNTEVCGDVPLLSYGGLPDYDVGANGAGQWGNYTRSFPAGVYNIFMRGSSPGGQADAASIATVTNASSAGQTATVLGTVTLPGTGGYQTYAWAPFKDASGNLVQFVGGAQETLRVTVDGGNYNANYYMLMPANTTLPAQPPQLTVSTTAGSGGSGSGGQKSFSISFQSLYGYNYYLDYRTNLIQGTWIQLLGPLPGNAAIQSFTDPVGSGDRFYRIRVEQ